MKKSSKVATLFLALVFLLSSYMLLKGHYEQHRFDINKVSEKKTSDYGSVLLRVFEQRNWDDLQLSKNFREKYKTKFDITKYAGKFVSYSKGSAIENGEELIIIIYQKEELFDFEGTKGRQYDLFFRYKVTGDGLLDDAEFIRMEERTLTTGKLLGVTQKQ